MSNLQKHKFLQPFLSEVHLKGYKSIRNSIVKLNKGLNIIIGPNGSGKSNFLDGLLNVGKYKIEGKINGVFSYFDRDEILWEYRIKSENYELISEEEPTQKIKETLKENAIFIIKNRVFELSKGRYPKDVGRLSEILKFLKISFGIPKGEIKLLNLNYNFSFDFNPKNTQMISYNFAFPKNEFERILISYVKDLFVAYIKGKPKNNFKNLNTDISDNTFFKKYSKHQFNYLISNLKKVSPIKNIKISEGYSSSLNKGERKGNQKLNLGFIKLLFLVNNDWLNWNQLSDGTKRLFYIIVMLSENRPYLKYLIEEPELGVHPDQLFKLMDFIKEKSKTNQIILTTHSPQVLNILNEDELDRIIITKYTKRSGTKMRHLSEEEIKNAKSVMNDEGLFLSDYWVHLNLEEGIKW